MKQIFGMSLVLFCLAAAAPALRAQAQGSNNDSSTGQSKDATDSNGNDAAQSPQVKTQNNANAFPEDTSKVPVMPTGNVPVLVPGDDHSAEGRATLPREDEDPVRSPEEAGAAAQNSEQNSSSSMAGMGDLLGGPDDPTESGKRGKKGSQAVPEHHETAAEDEDVGSYYLDSKNWRAALSRFQSAMVLDPDNPEVYWGLAESERHLGEYADARANYKKVVEYDPDSRRGKEARKALADPEIANAKPTASAPPVQ